MAPLVWNAVGERFYEAGVDRGVLYVDGQGYAWNGLVSVDQSPTGGEAKAYYVDGVKYLNISSREEFEATIDAFYSPPEFDACDGVGFVAQGLFATQQRRKSFGLSYRTRIGNDLNGEDHGYKIHLIYNALAAPSNRSYSSLGESAEAPLLSWGLTTKPIDVPGVSKTAHLVIDTTKAAPYSVQVLEEILYGSEVNTPRLPEPAELITLLADASVIEVIEVGDGIRYAITGDNFAIQELEPGKYNIRSHTVVPVSEDLVQISSSEE